MKKENHLNQNEKEGGTILQLAVYLVIILLINIAGIVAGLNFRIDLTGNDLYSLSEKSADVVSNLKENLTIKVLFSENLPGQFLKVSTQLKDLLEVYDYEGNEHFSYEIIRGKDLEAQAKDYGIEPLRTREIVDDEETGRISYMGIVIQHADLVEKMPRLITTEGLEYEITSRINKMSTKIDTLLGMKKEEMVEITLYLDSAVRQLPIDEINTVEKRIEDAVMGINPQNYNKLKFQLIDPSTQKEVSIINPKGSNEANEPKEAKPVSVADQYGINKLEWAAMTTASGEKLEAGSGVMAIIVKKGKRFKKINLNVANIPFTNKFIIPGLEKLDEMIGNAVSGVLGINQQIGYISGHGSVALNDPRGARGQNPQGLKFLKELLSDMYEIKAIDLSQESISDDIGTIIINGPKTAFTESELFKIDQFLLSGKSAVFFIDSFNEMQLQRGQQPVVFPVNTGLDKLLGHYGISVNKDIVLDSSCRKIPIQGEYREYYALPVIQQAGINMDSIITKYLKGAIFFKSSSITLDEKKLEKQGAESKELINSSGESWLMTGRINFDPRFMFPGKKEDMKS
ncbi:MAG: GldG family protein, partial [bacterium]|nr:GldG family protein [bacterium]